MEPQEKILESIGVDKNYKNITYIMSNQPSTITINTSPSTQGTFIFTNLQWDGPYFEGNATNSLTGEKGSVEGSDFFGGINATVALPGQVSTITTTPTQPNPIYAAYNSNVW